MKQNKLGQWGLILGAAVLMLSSLNAEAQVKKAGVSKKVTKASTLIDEKNNIVKRRLLVDERQFVKDGPRLMIPPALNRFQIPKAIAAYAAPDFKMISPEVKNSSKLQVLENTAIPKKVAAVPEMKPASLYNFAEPVENLTKVENYTPEELQLFEAFVLLEDRKEPIQAYGSFANLMVKKTNLTDSARWGFAHSALGIGLRIQYEMTLIEFVNSNDKTWKDRALKSLVEHSDAEKSFWVQMLTPEQFNGIQMTDATDAYLLLRSHRLTAQQKVKDAIELLAGIPKTSKLFGLKTYHEALLTYRQGGLLEALAVLENALRENPSAFSETSIAAKSKILLGRLAFQNREFSKAFEAYRSVPKSSPLWPEAMMEQALSQILYQDFEGAAGNMFSLHTDFYKKSYAPDSYIIRSVGYLNLCQYADALKVVQDLQRKYKPMLAAIDRYSKSTSAKDDFETIRSFAKDPSVSQVNGLPRPFLFYWTQDPNFERHQTRINQIEDEMETYRKLALEVVKNERDAAKKVAELSNSIHKSSASKVDVANQALENAKAEYKGLSESRKALTKMRPEFVAKMDELKSERKSLALKALNDRRTQLHSSLKDVIDQSEVLLYEVYSGAGENLRYQAAGGELDQRKTAALSGANDTSTNWKYKGEIWEDELGHFRSNLHSVCAKDSASTN